MSAAMADNQQKMLAAQREMALKQRETQLAMELARAKDRFHFYCGFYASIWVFGSLGAMKFKNPAPLVGPLIPTTWAFAFQYDLVYGDKLVRINAEAERMLRDDSKETGWRKLAPPPSSALLEYPGQYEDLFTASHALRAAQLAASAKA